MDTAANRLRTMSNATTTPRSARPADTSIDLLEQVAGALPGASQGTHHILADSAQRRVLKADEIAFRQGDPISLTLLLRGHAAFRRTTADGRELVLGIAAPGFLFGFSSIAGMPASVDLVAVTPIEIAAWPGDAIRRLGRDDPGLMLDVVDGMASHIVAITDRFDGFIHQEARRRVVRVLRDHVDLFFGQPPVLSRAHLPGLVGTSREMTGRVVRQLESEGIITRVGRRGLRLVSPARLHEAPGLGATEPPS